MAKNLKWIALTLALAITGLAARADDYPSHPIKLIVPFAPGGAADATARLIGKYVSGTIGQPMVIENRAGAGAIIGTEDVHRAAPDGYTLLLGQSGPISINPGVYQTLPYDPEKDFAPITMTSNYPYVLVVNAKLPAQNFKDFIAMVKAKPGEFNYGSFGVGSSNQLVTELLSSKAGLKMVHVPYRGTGPALNDLAAGIVDAYFGDPATLGLIKSGKARAMAVTSPTRWSVLPDAPALAEAVPGYQAENWYAIAAPPKTPEPVMATLTAAILKVMADPVVKAKYDEAGLHPATMPRAEYVAFLQGDSKTWGDVVAKGNIKIDES
jgi:tripartite-type tricarboxylate transporter receptor subunit TctC